MSIPESNSITPNPYAPATVAAPFDRWRWMLAGVIGILGGYLTVSAVNGGIVNALRSPDSYGMEQVLLFVIQGIFALAVTSFAFSFAPGPFGRRVLAIVLFVVVTIVLIAFLVGRISGVIRVPGQVAVMVANPFWVVLAVGGLGWLLASGARPIAYLTLLLTFIVMPLHFILVLNNIPTAIAALIQLPLSLVIAVVILLVSRPAGVPNPTTAATSPERSRWLLAGVVGILGGYLTLSSVSGGILNAIGNPGGSAPELLAQFVAQGVFALLATSFAFFVAPGPLGRRVLAVVLFIVIAIALVAFLVGRYWGDVRLPSQYFLVVLNPIWIVLFVGGLGWLLAAGARPVAYLSLLLTLIVMPLEFILSMSNVGYGLKAIIQLALSLAVAAVILIVSRPAASTNATPVATTDPAAASAAAELAPTAFVAMEEGSEADAAPRTPAP